MKSPNFTSQIQASNGTFTPEEIKKYYDMTMNIIQIFILIQLQKHLLMDSVKLKKKVVVH